MKTKVRSYIKRQKDMHDMDKVPNTLTVQFWRTVKIAGLLPATRETRPMYHRPIKMMWKTRRNRIEDTYIVKNNDKFILISTPID